MTEIMAQQGLGLSAPSNRQDIVSALLDDYGAAFGRGDSSPYNYSPVPALKELPPPPSNNSNSDKPLPPSASYMSMRFQLRVDEDSSPLSYNGSRKNSLEQPTKIVSRSLSRSSKPPSLKLLASNGATAIVPQAPTVSATATTVSSPRPQEEKQLPPPPPEKSERRQQSGMGQDQSKETRDRKDSMQSPEGTTRPRNESSASIDQQPAVKRKALPGQTLTKKFKSLAELGNGPRGGKGGPLPPMPAPRKQSFEQPQEHSLKSLNVEQQQDEEEPAARNALSGHRPNFSNTEVPVVSQMPPTPEEDKNPLPPPPKKTFAGMGLPSNPRARSQQEAPKHTRGKSSTGFDIMKNSRAQAPALNTITPGPTPSPKKTEQIQAESKIEEESSISPISSEEGQRRPFSFEAVSQQQQPQQRRQPQLQAQRPAPPPPVINNKPASPVSPLSEISQFPPRTTSRAPVAPNVPTIQTTNLDHRPQTAPSQGAVLAPAPAAEDPSTPTTPPFTPLTVRPRPTNCPPITHTHLTCYSHHSSFVRSGNTFQPMDCMICHSNDREVKMACVWCYLRICVACQQELVKTPGRDVALVMEKRGVNRDELGGKGGEDGGYPSVVVWEADGDASGDDFS